MREGKGRSREYRGTECADTEMRRQPGRADRPPVTGRAPRPSGQMIAVVHSWRPARAGYRIPNGPGPSGPAQPWRLPGNLAAGLFLLIAYNDHRHMADLDFLLNHLQIRD